MFKMNFVLWPLDHGTDDVTSAGDKQSAIKLPRPTNKPIGFIIYTSTCQLGILEIIGTVITFSASVYHIHSVSNAGVARVIPV